MDQDIQLADEKRTASLMAVSVAALRRWRREGRGPQFIRIERCVRYDLSSLKTFLEQNSSANKKAADSRSAAQREVRSGHAATRP